MTQDQIESWEFMEIGLGNTTYTFQRVEVNHPMQNVSGLTKIGDFYYKKVYKSLLSQMQETENKQKGFIDKMIRRRY